MNITFLRYVPTTVLSLIQYLQNQKSSAELLAHYWL